MSIETDKYFEKIAKDARAAVAQKFPGHDVPVVDGPQDAKSTAWGSRSVHPLKVLETDYIAEVQKAVASAGNDVDKAREKEFETMSKFYSLAATKPTLLVSTDDPLIEDRIAMLAAHVSDASALLEAQSDDFYDVLVAAVETAIDLLRDITTQGTVQYAEAPIQEAAKHLDPFQGASSALNNWKAAHPKANKAAWKQYLKTFKQNVSSKLASSDIAVASPRSLYNIEAFYLFRLMHRFLGGTSRKAMSLAEKGVASGAATGQMNAAANDWLMDWNEKQVIKLDTQLRNLGDVLKRDFKLHHNPIKFHLKGGRAMYTRLGQPQLGTNDWDTGVMIDPHLSPKQWYDAFARVNDLVLRFIDTSRFGYTELLNQNKHKLTLGCMSEEFDPDDDVAEYTQAGLIADHLEDLATQKNPAALIGAGHAPSRPSGVNGELIDIGISTRNSVELLEHWHMTINPRKGVTKGNVPVPDLAYFVDDFTGIIREALATDTVNRKLAKRLKRLILVFTSNDADFIKSIAERWSTVHKCLPKTVKAINFNDKDVRGKMIIWLLNALIQSAPSHAERESWTRALDDYISQNHAAIFSDNTITQVWKELAPEFSTPGEAQTAKGILIAQKAAQLIANVMLSDAKEIAKFLGGPDEPTQIWPSVYSMLVALIKRASAKDGYFSITGQLAARLQICHADIENKTNLAAGAIEVAYLPGTSGDVNGHLQRIANIFRGQAGRNLRVEHNVAEDKVSVYSSQLPGGLKVTPKEILVLQVRLAKEFERIHLPDYLYGLPVETTRSLVDLFKQSGSHCPDFDIRSSFKTSATYLLKNLLGRQIRMT